MKVLGEVEVRCVEHESSDGRCETCRWLKEFTEELALVKQHRGRLVKDLEARLATRNVVIVGLR